MVSYINNAAQGVLAISLCLLVLGPVKSNPIIAGLVGMILAFLQLLDGELSSALTSISSIPELVTALKRFAPAAAGVLTGTVVMVFVGFAPMEHLTITVRVVSVLVQAILSGISSWICANSSWRVSVLRGIASGGVGAGILELTYLVSTTLTAYLNAW